MAAARAMAHRGVSACIPWWGTRRADGYGRIRTHTGNRYAHRAVYEECFGPLPEGSLVHHTCENKSCVNPEHLEAVTRGDHNRIHDIGKRTRWTHTRQRAWPSEET